MRTLNLVISICAVVVVTWITSILTYFDHLATMDYKKDYDSHSFENFDWIAYLELNPLIAKSLPYRSSYFAFRHYKTEGVKKGIPFTSLYPNGISLQLAMSKLEVFTRNVDIKNYMKNTLVVIHLHEKDITESNGVLQNNLILINDAIQRDGGVLSESEMSNNFYWINIIRRRSHENHVGAKDIVNGGILQYLSCFSQHNVAVAYWQISPSDMHTHFQTLSFLWKTINRYIGSVMLLNQGVRGPFSMRNRGDWVAHFRSKLFGPNNLALFGPTMSCEVRAHVQTHAVMIKMEVVTTIINEYKQFKLVENWIELVRRYEVNLSKLMLKNGYYIDATWRPNCTSTSRAIHSAFTNPSSQHLPISDLVLIKWGGEMLRRRGFISPEMAVDVRHQTKEVLTTTPNLPLIDLEYFRGGIWSKLHLEYDKEFAHSSSLNERMGEIRKPCSNFVCILRVDEDINITRNTSLQTCMNIISIMISITNLMIMLFHLHLKL